VQQPGDAEGQLFAFHPAVVHDAASGQGSIGYGDWSLTKSVVHHLVPVEDA
jgi:hypothetical protein